MEECEVNNMDKGQGSVGWVEELKSHFGWTDITNLILPDRDIKFHWK